MKFVEILAICAICIGVDASYIKPSNCNARECKNNGVCIVSFTHPMYHTCECPYGFEEGDCSMNSDIEKQEREEVPIIEIQPARSFNAHPRRSIASPAEAKMYSENAWIPEMMAKMVEYASVFSNNVIMSEIHTIDSDYWLQVDFQRMRQLHRVVTKGSAQHPYWVKSYKVGHSSDGYVWFMMHTVESGEETVFLGNTDQNTAVSNHVPGHRETISVRIYPQTWHEAIALRLEIYGCEVPVPDVETTMADEVTMDPGSSSEESDEDAGISHAPLAALIFIAVLISSLL